MNDLREFFYNRVEGLGIWKWDHYFDIYEKHFSRFRGTNVNILEIGIYSGGSLEMWRDYFGPAATIHGVDIQPECKVYEELGFNIHIGDQSNDKFWEKFKTEVPTLDIVVDDGSHKPRHQSTTFNALFPYIRPGGVFLCEDIHGYPDNEFAKSLSYVATGLCDHTGFQKDRQNNDRRLSKKTIGPQINMKSVSFYPYVIVVEKNIEPVTEFVAPKRGTEWQPFIP